jgi:ribosomal protein S13
MLEQANINENTTFHHLSNQQLTHLAEHFKQFIFTVNGTLRETPPPVTNALSIERVPLTVKMNCLKCSAR